MKHLTLFRIVYMILLGFVLIDFCLSIFGLSFTPILWDSWLFLLVITLFIRFCRHLVILDLLFGIFGIQFIPMIFKTGQFVPIILAIVHILSYCFKERYRLFEGILHCGFHQRFGNPYRYLGNASKSSFPLHQ